MKKEKDYKLRLDREIVRNLQLNQLTKVAGGVINQSGPSACDAASDCPRCQSQDW